MSMARERARLNRREFIELTGAGALATWSSMPLAGPATASIRPLAPTELIADWTIDDMWGVYPRYAEAIGYGKRREDRPAPLSGADGIFSAYV